MFHGLKMHLVENQLTFLYNAARFALLNNATI